MLETVQDAAASGRASLADAERFQPIIDAMTAHMALLDAGGWIIGVNEAWKTFARENGGGDNYWIGANYLAMLERMDRTDPCVPEGVVGLPGQIAQGLRAVLSGATDRFQLEYPCDSPTKRRWFLLSITPLPWRERIRAVVAHENLTELKAVRHELSVAKRIEQALVRERDRAEGAIAKLRATQESLILAEKQAALADLVAGLAHEMNTPLGVALTGGTHLLGLVQETEAAMAEGSLTRTGFSDTMAASRRTLELLISSIERTSRLVETFKQIAADRDDEDPVRFALRPLVEDLWRGALFRDGRTGLSLDLDVPEDLFLTARHGAMARLLMALIDNAFDHAFAGRSSGRLTVTSTLDAGRLGLSVEDDGPGLRAEDQSRIFDPFFTKARGRGKSGLGLNIAFNLATRALGGRLHCEAAAQGGARFVLDIPDA